MKKFFHDRIKELHTVTWPTQKQATAAAVTVLTIMLLVGFGLGFVDYTLNELILFLLNK